MASLKAQAGEAMVPLHEELDAVLRGAVVRRCRAEYIRELLIFVPEVLHRLAASGARGARQRMELVGVVRALLELAKIALLPFGPGAAGHVVTEMIAREVGAELEAGAGLLRSAIGAEAGPMPLANADAKVDDAALQDALQTLAKDERENSAQLAQLALESSGTAAEAAALQKLARALARAAPCAEPAHLRLADVQVRDARILGSGHLGEVMRAGIKFSRAHPRRPREAAARHIDLYSESVTLSEARAAHLELLRFDALPASAKVVRTMALLPTPGHDAGDVLHVSELCDMTLADLLFSLKSDVPDLSLLQRVTIAQEVALALRDLHMHGRVHGDVRPRNVLLGREFTGGARLRAHGPAVARVKARLTSGTLSTLAVAAYAAPEVYRAPGTSAGAGDSDVVRWDGGPAVDMYAFGVLLWETVARELAWGDGRARVQRSARGAAAALKCETPTLQALRPLIDGLLLDDAGKRPTAEEALAAITRLRETLMCAPEADAGSGGSATRRHRSSRVFESLRTLLRRRGGAHAMRSASIRSALADSRTARHMARVRAAVDALRPSLGTDAAARALDASFSSIGRDAAAARATLGALRELAALVSTEKRSITAEDDAVLRGRVAAWAHGAVPLLLRLLRFSNEPQLVAPGAQALRFMLRCFQNSPRLEALELLGAAPLLVDAMRRARGSAEVLQWLVGVVLGLYFKMGYAVSLMDAGAPAALLAAARAHPESAEVQSAVAAAMCNVANAGGGAEALFEEGAVEVVVNAMRAHEGSARVQLEACGFFWNLTGTEERAMEALEGGAVDCAVSAMGRHALNVEMQFGATGMLRRMGFHQTLKVPLMRKGVAQAVLAAIENHLDEAGLMAECCHAIDVLSRSSMNSTHLVRLEAHKGLIRAIERHHATKVVQVNGCAALVDLTVARENMHALAEADAHRVMLKAARMHLDDPFVGELLAVGIYNFSINGHAPALVRWGAGQDLVRLLRLQGGERESRLLEEICQALFVLARDSSSARRVLVMQGALEALQAVTAPLPQDAPEREQVDRTLALLAGSQGRLGDEPQNTPFVRKGRLRDTADESDNDAGPQGGVQT